MASVLAMTQPTPSVTDANPRLRLIEDRLGESLAVLIETRRAEGRSWSRIASELNTLTGIYITGEALRKWHQSRADEVAA